MRIFVDTKVYLPWASSQWCAGYWRGGPSLVPSFYQNPPRTVALYACSGQQQLPPLAISQLPTQKQSVVCLIFTKPGDRGWDGKEDTKGAFNVSDKAFMHRSLLENNTILFITAGENETLRRLLFMKPEEIRMRAVDGRGDAHDRHYMCIQCYRALSI